MILSDRRRGGWQDSVTRVAGGVLVEANDLVMRRLERMKRRIVLDKYSDTEGFKKRRHWWWFVYEPCFRSRRSTLYQCVFGQPRSIFGPIWTP